MYNGTTHTEFVSIMLYYRQALLLTFVKQAEEVWSCGYITGQSNNPLAASRKNFDRHGSLWKGLLFNS